MIYLLFLVTDHYYTQSTTLRAAFNAEPTCDDLQKATDYEWTNDQRTFLLKDGMYRSYVLKTVGHAEPIRQVDELSNSQLQIEKQSTMCDDGSGFNSWP